MAQLETQVFLAAIVNIISKISLQKLTLINLVIDQSDFDFYSV